jgi:hypothetical protein
MKHLFVLIDALGWTYLDGREFLSDVLPFRRPLRTVLGFSSGAIPAILTGMPPARNGHWNLFYYDPAESPFRWLRKFLFLPDAVLDCRIASKILKELGRRVLGLGSGFECCVPPHLLPWFNFSEKKSIYEHGGITGTSSIFDRLEQAGVRHRIYTYHNWNDAEILREARRDLARNAADFYFIYLSEVDGFLHHHCMDAPGIDEKLGWYEQQLRDLFQFARSLDPSTGMTVFSDHGMTPVERRHDLFGEIEPLGLRMPEDYLAVYDSTMARFWFFSDRSRQELTQVLRGSICGHILDDAELERLGIRFPDHRFGELVFLLKPGWLIARSGFENPRWIPSGMHGYHPDDRYSDACFLSDREPPVEVRTIIDVYDCMHHAAFQTCATE